MSGEFIMGIAWGIVFCLPATIILVTWYWIDERGRSKRGSCIERLERENNE